MLVILSLIIAVSLGVLVWCAYSWAKLTLATSSKPRTKQIVKEVVVIKEVQVPANKNRQVRTHKQGAHFVGFGDAIINFFSGFFDYKGTATRAEYWWIKLLSVILCAIAGISLNQNPETYLFWLMLYFVACCPNAMLCIRRMHDIGLSGWVWFGLAYGVLGFGSLLLATTMPLGITANATNPLVIIATLAFGVAYLAAWIYLIVLFCRPSMHKNNPYRTAK